MEEKVSFFNKRTLFLIVIFLLLVFSIVVAYIINSFLKINSDTSNSIKGIQNQFIDKNIVFQKLETTNTIDYAFKI